ncbi:ankyrin repeat domain-containing protein 10-like [Parambassis ranga]|uniref:Ankyrin repeat domain-containing protein 10-like n=1 Tax=Parambassis ranga TaxID=210632 RepID=A0A6P7HDL6_9TELE|nr:ankyrin repeat domain-containing protein 10-like [Parambassis ranga]
MSVGAETDLSSDEVFVSRFPVHRACRDGDVGALTSLLEDQMSNHAHLLTAKDSCYGWTPLHWAAHYGQLECVMHLAQAGCEVNAASSRFNQTPTHTAAFGGHSHCVLWLTQAGADVNTQDFVGEAPIHKAARSGSLECIQVLLIAGAKPHLRNASGQTAADLAFAHGFHGCVGFISDAQQHLQQIGSNQGLLSRKRQLVAMDSGHMKKARRADGAMVQLQNSACEEAESMNTELSSDDSRRPYGTLPSAAQSSPPANQRSSADMCGSLHLTGSPSSYVSHRPAWWADCSDSLRYGHYHGFGDTAEELSESSQLEYSSSIQAEHRYKQAVASAIHLYHGS